MQFSKLALTEQRIYKLLDDPEYEHHCREYNRQYDARKPVNSVPTRNMLKALRCFRSLNTAEDWARLHVTEARLKTVNKATKRKLMAGFQFKAIGS